MKNSKDNLIEIESFPVDDKTYVVINYGGFIKNYSFAIDIPLVNVSLGVVIDGVLIKDAITILVGLPELSTVRIGTMWKNRQRIDTYWNKYNSYEELMPLSFDLEESPAECIIYKKAEGKKGLTEINLSKNESLELEFNNEIYGSTFVKFKSKDNIDFIVPSIELLMSTYLPRNKLIRNEIVLKSVDTVIQNYINDYSVVDEIYNINIDKSLEIETMYFLAYIACNKKSKSNISKIWSNLECSTSDKIKYPFILPYHPKVISFKATGIWIEKNLFYIQRIYEPQVPSEINVISTKH